MSVKCRLPILSWMFCQASVECWRESWVLVENRALFLIGCFSILNFCTPNNHQWETHWTVSVNTSRWHTWSNGSLLQRPLLTTPGNLLTLHTIFTVVRKTSQVPHWVVYNVGKQQTYRRKACRFSAPQSTCSLRWTITGLSERKESLFLNWFATVRQCVCSV